MIKFAAGQERIENDDASLAWVHCQAARTVSKVARLLEATGSREGRFAAGWNVVEVKEDGGLPIRGEPSFSAAARAVVRRVKEVMMGGVYAA